MTAQLKFFLLLLENYAIKKQRPTADVLAEWDRKQLTKTIFEGYELYHQETLENAFADIDALCERGTHAW